MFRSFKAWKQRDSPIPWSNDPHLNKRYMNIVWRERNGAAIGRSLMAWTALIGWALFFYEIGKG